MICSCFIGALYLALVPAASAEYVALRNGQRLHVTSYQLNGDRYRLRLDGGVVEVAAQDVAGIEPEDVFISVPAPPESTVPYQEFVKAAAERYAVDVDLIRSVIAAESNFDAKAVSRKNACGLMQLRRETAARLGVRNIFDPQENIDAGTRYLKDLLQRYNNDLVLALAAYNAGPEKVQLYGRVPPYAETVSYVRRVKRAYEQRKTVAAGAGSRKGASKERPGSAKSSPSTNSPQVGSSQASLPN